MIFGKHINRYYLKYGPMLLLGLIALVMVDALQLEIPKLYGAVIDGMKNGVVVLADGSTIPFDMTYVLDTICMPMVKIILAMVFGRFLWRVCFLGSAVKLEEQLRNRMFDHAKDLSREYYQVNKVGDLMSLFTNDLDTVQECFGWGIMMFFDAVLLGVLAINDMLRMSPMLTLLCLIPMAFLLASATIVGKRLTKKWDIRQEAFSKLSDFSQESFSGIAVIKAFVKEGKELWAFKKLNVENEDANIDHTKTSVTFRVLVTLFVESVICIILGYGGYLVYQGQFTGGQLMEFIGYFNAIIWPVMAVSELIDMTSRGKASMNRIAELLDAPVHVKDKPGVQELADIRGDIEFRDLTFRYPDGEFDALRNVSFTINAGENVGLVGKTGSGKTTLVDLILRTYNVPDGTVFIDGHDVNEVSIRSVRDGCAYVPQDNFLFSDTIENNIAFGVDKHDQNTVANAAKLADIHSNIREFSKGYGTVLGERGVTVSGGQKQRISIARALLKDAPILILDDSVSAVDTKTETTILSNLRQTRAGRTTILIAHRISTIEKMDKILFIDDGALVAVGTHEALYESNAEYRKMVDLQRLEEEEGGDHNA
ncbi:MAG: ABC transporter ATP-binding protein [Ruminococcaceae bacterium]|nr:ABC transporter ATP-binding protein [Oscillospiraceae bacterium]